MSESEKSDAAAKNPDAAAPAEAKKGKKSGLIAVVGGALFCIAAAVVVGLVAFPAQHAEMHEAAEPEKPVVTFLFPVPQVLVNVAETKGSKILQSTMQIEFETTDLIQGQAAAGLLLPKLQDGLLKVLSTFTPRELEGSANKDFIQTRIKDAFNKGMLDESSIKIRNVYFTEFVLQ